MTGFMAYTQHTLHHLYSIKYFVPILCAFKDNENFVSKNETYPIDHRSIHPTLYILVNTIAPDSSTSAISRPYNNVLKIQTIKIIK